MRRRKLITEDIVLPDGFDPKRMAREARARARVRKGTAPPKFRGKTEISVATEKLKEMANQNRKD